MTDPESIPEGVGRTALWLSGLDESPARWGGRFGWDADVTRVAGRGTSP